MSNESDELAHEVYKSWKRTYENNMKLLEKVESYAELETGWDSYKAPPINTKCIETAKRMINSMDLVGWHVFPTISGGIQFEEDGGNGVEITVFPPIDPFEEKPNE